MQAHDAQPTQTKFTVKQFAAKEPAFSESSLRAFIFNADKNGLTKSKAIVRAGRKVLIDAAKFEQWLDSQAGA